MNHFSLEVMGKEKVRDFQEEGLRNQAVHRSGAPKLRVLPCFSKLIFAVLGILGILALLVR